MDNGIYIALSRQLALFRDMAETTNNISNANTTGFQAEKMIFSAYLDQDNNSGDRNKMAFANDVSSYRYVQEGAKRVTGNPLDVALQGNNSYFIVQTPLGNRYTRAGNFSLDGEGKLVTPEGYPVLDTSGQALEFPPDTQEVIIGSAGNIKINGEDFGSIGVAQFENPQLLTQTFGGLYQSEVEPTIGNEETVRMSQGALEGANVQPITELTHMIDVSRSVGSTAKYIETIYDLQRKTTNTWTQQG
ncbi:MAG: flagellar hook-basal body complex protein [Alphaproteobacteria bacterium]|nr:flagellar hook-basal body complex protein [Alphaproteobacteria bacterium]